MYNLQILLERFTSYKNNYIYETKLLTLGLKIRRQNPPEDITENLAKHIISKCEYTNSIVWCKEFKQYSGDLYNTETKEQMEIKSFTSNGPIQFSPTSKFDCLYFLDLKNFVNDQIILYKVYMHSESEELYNIKVNKSETFLDQKNKGRRPRLSWKLLYPQISEYCEEIYNGNIFDILTIDD